MVRYSCPRCGLVTTNKRDFIDHLQRKNKCPPTLDDVDLEPVLKTLMDAYESKPFACEHCDKRFSHSSSMYTHKKSCVSRPSTSRPEQASITNTIVNGDHNVINVTNNNVQHIHINPAEYADATFVTHQMYDQLVSLVKRPGQVDVALLRLVKILFCNNNHPENYCVYIPNKKFKRALLWDGSSWKYDTTKEAVKEIRNKAYYLIVDHYDQHYYKFGLFTQQEWNAFINRVKQTEPTVFKNTDEKIGLELLNNTDAVKEHIKNKQPYSDTSLWDLIN